MDRGVEGNPVFA